MMGNNIKSETEKVNKAFILSVDSSGYGSLNKIISRATGRFCDAASPLSKFAFLGIQFMPSRFRSKLECAVFYGTESDRAKSEFNRIFYDYATVSDKRTCRLENLFDDNRKVYTMRPIDRVDHFTDISADNLRSLYDLMLCDDTIIRIILRGSSSEYHGRIYLSTTQEISLRMMRAIDQAFPELEPEEQIKPERNEVKRRAPGECIDYIPEILKASFHILNDFENGDENPFEEILEQDEEQEEEDKKEEVNRKMEPDDVYQTDLFENERCMAELNEMIGLDNVKKHITEVVAYAKMKKDMDEKGIDSKSIVLNMEFVGNPGTAKTTVARIVAGIFYEIGLTSSKELIEVGRADLVAKYVGQTAIKVKKVFKRARGKVLFIDEAYSLVEAWDNSYGDEAISTIVQEMENNRDDIIVIFAGYPDKMKNFMSRNPGLRSRVPNRITFEDYSAQELAQIAQLEARNRSFRIAKDAREKLLQICNGAIGNSEMGNGRFSRNLVERSICHYAVRKYGPGGRSKNDGDFILTKEDIQSPEMPEEKPKQSVGFQCDISAEKYVEDN